MCRGLPDCAHLLQVYVQVNSSGEASKHGVTPGEELALARHIIQECPALCFQGLMTIGMADFRCTPANFACLRDCRQRVAEACGMNEGDLELSMGMSGDFELAVAQGSTNVRVGTHIFGARPSKPAK